MEIWFASTKLQKLFSSKKNLKKKYDNRMVDLIQLRLADLAGCDVFRDAFSIPGRMHPLKGARIGTFALDLVHPNRLIIVPANEPIPYLDVEESQLDYDQIDEIEVQGIVDYH